MTIDSGNRHVVHILAGLDTGGNESLCLSLIRNAPALVRSTVLVLVPERRELESEFTAAPRTNLVWAPRGASRAALIRWAAAQLRVPKASAALVYGLGLDSMFIAGSARVLGVKVVAAHVGNPPPVRGLWKIRILVGGARLLGIPICGCSAAVDRSLRALRIGMPSGSAPIPNGCDVTWIHQRAMQARQQRPSASPLTVSMVARIDEIKDHETLLRAFAIAYDSGRGPDAQLWVVGDGVRRPALEALAAVLGISARVRFLGTRSDISEVLGQTDIFAFSTTPNEGFGIALIEAMSAELPIVATDVPACREVLGDGEAGILVAPQDAQALANALRELLSSDSKRAAWGIRALSRVQREYGIADCARQWYQLLDCGEERQPPK